MAHIEDFSWGQIVVDGQTYDRDLILLPEGIAPNWWRREGHVLRVSDLDAVFAAKPEVLVVGCGVYRRLRVPRETRKALDKAGIELVVLPTKKACATYEEMVAERRVAAAFHLTC
jgi:hypothetical protein